MYTTDNDNFRAAVQTGRAPAAFWNFRELAMVGLLAAATILIAGYFASDGGYSGFINFGHDGYNLQEMVDLQHGGTLFKDTYEQYGPLGPYLNLAGFEVFGKRLLALRYAMCFWYGLTAIVLYRSARHFLSPALSAFSLIAWLAIAPFYEQGVMISVHAYVLFAQAAATLALLKFVDSSQRRWLVVAGFFCGVSCITKQSVGFIFAVGIGAYFTLCWVRRTSTFRQQVRNLTIVGATTAGVILAMLGFLWTKGALADWYRQSILFPKQFYLGTAGGAAQQVNGVFSFVTDFIHAQISEGVAFEWYLMRAVLALVVVVAMFRRNDARAEKLVLVGTLTVVLFAAAYPSAAIMHQWWTMSIGVAGFVYCIHIAAGWLVGLIPRLRSHTVDVTMATMVLILLPGVSDRIDVAEGRLARQRETIAEPWVIAGIKTEPHTLVDLRVLMSVLRNYRSHHPGAQLISIDASDGWLHGVAESLLWLTLIDNNAHPHPVYWSMPVLSTQTYPEYQPLIADYIRRTHPLLGEASVNGFKPRDIEGYYLLYATYTTRGMYWYLYAPVHDEAERHGETRTIVRLAPPPPYPPAPPPPPVAPPFRPEGRDVYRWPPDTTLTVPLLAGQLAPLTSDIQFLAKNLVSEQDGWSFDGHAEDPRASLIETREVSQPEGMRLVVRGELVDGGLCVGLQRGQQKIGEVSIQQPGRFMAVLRAPDGGPYEVVVSHCLTLPSSPVPLFLRQLFDKRLLHNQFKISSAGWTH